MEPLRSKKKFGRNEKLPNYFAGTIHIRKSFSNKRILILQETLTEANHQKLLKNQRRVHKSQISKKLSLEFQSRNIYGTQLSSRQKQKREDGKLLTRYEEEMEMVTPRRDGVVTPDKDTLVATTHTPPSVFLADDGYHGNIKQPKQYFSN